MSIHAGVPQEVSAYNVNIACGSGMKATQLGAQQIMLGEAEVVLVGGMENMTRVPYLLPDMRLGYRLGNTEVVDAMYRDGLLDPLCGLIMGETAENLVDMYDISREEQDAFALESQQKADVGQGAPRGRDVPGGRVGRARGAHGRRGRARPTADHPGVPRGAGAGLPRRRQRDGRELLGTHRRRRRHGRDVGDRVPSPRVANRWRASSA